MTGVNNSRSLRIRPLLKDDISRIGRLHATELSGFLPELGERFLRLFYEKSLAVPEMFTFVAIGSAEGGGGLGEKEGLEKERIIGFVTGVTHTRGLYKKILNTDRIRFGTLLLGYIVTHPFKIVKIVQTLLYPGFDSDESELLTLVVDKNYRMKGLGRKLVQSTANEFKKRGIASFLISVYARLPANGFYEKIGCTKEKEFTFLGETMKYYRYNRLPR